MFDAKNPFIAHHVLPLTRGNESPSSVPDESIILGLHGLNLLRILENACDSARFRDRWKDGGEAVS